MKKLAWRRIIMSAVALGLLIYVAVSLYYTSQKNEEVTCNKIEVIITDKDKLGFVTEGDVLSILKSSGIAIIGQPVQSVKLAEIEKLLDTKSYIKDAEVYTTIDGVLNVKLKQRTPVVRVHTPSGAFYMDNEGFVFPLSKTYSYYVPVVTGSFVLPFKLPYKGELPDKSTAQTLRRLLGFVEYLNNDSFWNAQIEQINILPNADTELITRVGNHVVRLGQLVEFEKKLKRLFTFYQKVSPVEGWDKYPVIDLRFNNQVVGILK